MACNVAGAEGTCSAAEPGGMDACFEGFCDGSGNCITGVPEWAMLYGAFGDQQALGSAWRAQGLAVAGDNDGALLPGGFSYGIDGFVYELNGAGTVVWAVEFTDGDTQRLTSVVGTTSGLAVAGSCYTSGTFQSFGGSTFTNPSCASNDDVILARVADGGMALVGSPKKLVDSSQGRDQANALANRSDGAVAVGFEFEGPLRPLAGDGVWTAAGVDSGVALFTSAWADTWSAQVGGSGNETVTGVAFDPAGDVIAVGNYNGSFPLQADVPPASSGVNVFLVKLDGQTGAAQWGLGFGNGSVQTAVPVAIGNGGEILVGGAAQGTVELGGGVTLTGGTARRGFLLAVSDAGVPMWAYNITGDGVSGILDLAVTPDGNIAIAGSFTSTITIAATHDSAGGEDAFVALLTADGRPLWSHASGGAGDSYACCVEVDDDGVVYAVGNTDTPVAFGLASPATPVDIDVWVARFAK